jgi:zinc protease
VKNERRQSYENAPYGMASIEIAELMYPKGHPYRWPPIGYMEDLTAASYEDVVEFFRAYYQPSNASLVVAGDIDPVKTRAAVEKWFAEVKPGSTPIAPTEYPRVNLTEVKAKTITDRVQLPRLYLTWVTPPHLTPGDAELDLLSLLLAGGKNSRLYKRLVYELQIAQDVAAFQGSRTLNSEYQIIVTARPGASIDKIKSIVDEELRQIQQTPPTEREFRRALNQTESSFYDRMERVGDYGGVADQMNNYYFAAGNPGYFTEDLSRYRALSPTDITAAAARFLPLNKRVELIVEPAK